jgi:hypothetical protein
MPDIVKEAARYLKASKIILTHPSVLKGRNYIFFLSHIRGYTTLLSHILGSHSEISGYAETWTSYRTALHLLKLRCAVCSHGNYKPNCTYFLDKILHNRLQISRSILNRTDIRYIFMIRRPVPTMKSMLAFYRKYIEEGGTIAGCTLPGTVEDAVLHYTSRMTVLADIGARLRRLGKRALVIRAEDLISDPRSVLSELQTFLNLKSALDEHYSMFDHTGAWNLSDTSEFIRKGKIERERPPHAEISIPDNLSDKANREYERCLAALTDFFPLAVPAEHRHTASAASEA